MLVCTWFGISQKTITALNVRKEISLGLCPAGGHTAVAKIR